tara:strand:+ start:4459 stop:4650 length:192 start_codon:yes stop_codon:yes gene_type:complete
MKNGDTQQKRTSKGQYQLESFWVLFLVQKAISMPDEALRKGRRYSAPLNKNIYRVDPNYTTQK